MDPDPTLNFEPGETIYENKKVLEWARFWKTLAAGTLISWPAFMTFEIYAADGTPSLNWISENWNWWQIPQQFQDGSGWDLHGVRYCDDHDYMNIQYGIKRSIARPSHTFYILGVLALLQNINLDYVTRVVYNKEKDLVFVYRPDGLWGESEHVYEVHHLEQMVPSPVTAYKDMSIQRDDGILNLYCMSTRNHMRLYNESKYWNLDVREEFLNETRSLWRNNTQKDSGRLFTIHNAGSDEDALIVSCFLG